MNIGHINADNYSFYNSVSRTNVNQVNSASALQKASEAKEVQSQESKESTSSAIYQREDYSGPQYTQVSPENSYQKTMLSDTKFAMERMASKLMDKLPQILKDMNATQNVAPESAPNAASSKVVIAENDYLSQQAKNAQQQDMALQDISL